MNPKTRNLIQYSVFTIVFLIVAEFVYCSIADTDSENIIASVSLLIAVISLFLTTFTFNQHLDSKLPQIVVDTDTKSRYGLILLSIKNYGEKTAYNIMIFWNTPIKNHKGENIISQDIDLKKMYIPVLQKGQEIKATIDEMGSYYKKYKDEEMRFSGEIKYSIKNTQKRRTYKSTFFLDLSIYRKTLYHENESIKAYYELQKIPKELEEIKKLIKNK